MQPLTQERFGPICQTPYHYQAEACRRILSGQVTVVATGTGSGKTETFLAKRLLTEIDLPAPELARSAGFNSREYLAAVFTSDLDVTSLNSSLTVLDSVPSVEIAFPFTH